MKYSYIHPRKKTPLTPEMQLVVIFFSIAIGMLLLTYSFLVYKDYSFAEEKIALSKEKNYLQNDIAQLNDKIAYIEKQKMVAEDVYTHNTVLKDSMKNLFDLVPERITLSKAILKEKGLVLYGVTPNKDVYEFMLQAPLRSIFQKTYTSFYPASDGWLHFVSTNFMVDEDEELNVEN
jgi:hypothetical protein